MTSSAKQSRPRRGSGATKSRRDQRDARRAALRQIVGASGVSTQDALAEALARRGFRTTQATLSRDLAALGVTKGFSDSGDRLYRLPAELADTSGMEEVRSHLTRTRLAGQMLLLFCEPGAAGLLGRLVDELDWDDVAGTIAGDDTLLVVTASVAAAKRVRSRLVGGYSQP